MLKTALIVDDSRLARLTLKRLLVQYDIQVSEAEGVIDAERWIQNNLMPDLVFMDVMMPELDGFEGLMRMRANPDTRHVPVIMYSGDISEEARKKARDHGATGYLPKPADANRLDHLLNALSKRVKGSEKPAAAAQPAAAAPAAAPSAPAPGASAASNNPFEFASDNFAPAHSTFEQAAPQPRAMQPQEAPAVVVSPEVLSRINRLEERFNAQKSGEAQLELGAELERQRRDIVYLQRQVIKLEQLSKTGLGVAALAVLIGLAAAIRSLL